MLQAGLRGYRGRKLAPWSRGVCVVLSLFIALFGVLHYLREFERASMADLTYTRVATSATLLGGVIIGAFFTLVASGELTKLWRSPLPDTNNRDSKTSSQ
jgi:hypothetical protein